VSITPASGGTSISADTAATGGTGAWTSLGAISITELLSTDIAAGNNVTLVLSCPVGFQFRTDVTPSISVSGLGNVQSASIAVTSSTNVTITLTVGSGLSVLNTINIGSTSPLQVRPTVGTPLASGEHIFRPADNPGTANIAGVTTSADGSTGSNFGTLTEVAGATTRMFLTLPGETFTAGQGNSGTPTAQTAGTAFNIARLSATDNFTNPATSYTGNKTITYSGPGGTATYTTTVNFSAGQSTTTLATTLRKAETITITASASGVTGVPSSSLTIQPTSFSALQLLTPGETAAPGTTTGKTGTPTSETAGTSFNVTINAVDANWNPLNTVGDTVHMASTDANAVLPTDTAMANGTVTLPITFHTSGSRTLTASDVTNGARTPNTSPSITVNPGALSSLQILLPGESAAPGTATGKTGSPGVQAAGTAFMATVNAVDANWNLVTTANGSSYTIHLTSTDANATIPADNNLASGTRNFSVTFKTAGNWTVTASDIDDATVTPSTSALVTARAGTFTKLQLLVPGETAAAGTANGKTGTPISQLTNVAFTVTVNAVDANWNLINTNDTIHITSSDTAAVLPANAALVAGTKNLSATLRTPGTNLTLTASDVTHASTASSTSASIIVLAKAQLRGGPIVAIHDSEYTRALESITASPPTPSGTGTTGKEWWPTNWHYFVMPEALAEALRSDGTAFDILGDADIAAGKLLDVNGQPKYPILISLASEAIGDEEISPLTNYVAAGGFVLAGSSAFTRNTNGTTRGDFAIANAMGVHTLNSGLTNWRLSGTFSKVIDHRLVSHIPTGTLAWEMPGASEEIPWGIYPHPGNPNSSNVVWQVQSTNATVIAMGDTTPLLLDRQYNLGHFIYYAAMQPLIGNSSWSPGMYSYVMLRKTIEWAFENAKRPLAKVSAWPYAYDAALMVRHDLEDFANEIAAIEASAQVEFTNGVKGDYFFCTGTLRSDMSAGYDTNAVIAGMRRAISNYNASIAPHNGGLRNPYNTPPLTNADYDFWHWGPDEALDITPPGYASGKAYALASISNSFMDIEQWLPGQMTNGMRIWVAPYFDANRENSLDIESQLGVKVAGEQKLSFFPHWTVSTATSGKKYPFISVPVSDWYVGNVVAQSLEAGHSVSSIHALVDFYYGMGGLINLYGHTLANGIGTAGSLATEYVTYGANTNLHPRAWPVNAIGLYNWWQARSPAQITPTFTANGDQGTLTLMISGTTDPNTAVEALMPGTFSGLQVLTNGVQASGTSFRTNGSIVKVQVGTSVTNVTIQYLIPPSAQNDFYTVAAGSTLSVPPPGVLANDLQGAAGSNLTAVLVSSTSHGSLTLTTSGGFTYVPLTNFSGFDSFTYQASDGLTNSSSATVTLSVLPPGTLFLDDFSRPGDPASLMPWIAHSGNWAITGGVMKGGLNPLNTYASVYLTNSWTNYTVQARVQFPVGAFGGGVGGRLNPLTGAHYAAWVYPENSPGGSSVLKLIKFQTWTSFGYNGVSGAPIQQVSLPSVGTNWHTVNMALNANQITVSYDGVQLISTSDTEAQPYLTGCIDFDMWTDVVAYNLMADDVLVQPILPAPIPSNDAYTVTAGTTLTVPSPGVLANDTSAAGPLISILSSGPSHGALNLSTNGGFTYTPATNFVGSDSFTYLAMDSSSNSASATVILSVLPVGALFYDNFSRSTDPGPLTPWLVHAGNWSVTGGTLQSGPNPLQSYAFSYLTNSYSDFAFEARVQFPAGAYGAGLAGRLNPATGAHYAAWVYPEGSPGGSSVLRLFKFQTWTSFGYNGSGGSPILSVNLPGVGTNWHTVKLAFHQRQIAVYYDGVQVLSVADTEAQPYMSGGVGFDMWTDSSAYTLSLDDAKVSPLVADDVYTTAEDTLLSVPAPGVLANDSAVYGTNPVSIVLGNPANGTVTLNTNGGFNYLPATNFNGLDSFTYQVIDVSTNLGTGTVTVSVLPVRDAPILPQQTDRTIAELTTLTVTNTATDSDASPTNLIYALVAPPDGIQIDSKGVITWTPSEAQGPGSYVITTIVTDTNAPPLSATNSFTVVVNEINQAPVLGALPNLTVTALTPITVTNTATDPDIPVNTLTYVLTTAPANAQIDTNGIITWTPTVAQVPSINVFTTVVTDFNPDAVNSQHLSATNTFTVTVNPIHNGPSLPAQTNVTINEQTLLTVTNTASDSDIPALTLAYSLLNPPAGAQIDTNGIITWTPSEAQDPSTNLITTMVTDSGSPPLSATNSFVVVVNEVNLPPVLPILSNITIAGLTPVVITNTATDPDIPVNTLTYVLTTAPANAQIDTNGVIAWTPTVAQVPSTNVFTTVVTDFNADAVNSQHLSATNSFTVTVNPIHNGPSLPAQTNVTINEQTLLTITNTASDSDIPALALTYALLGAPTGAQIDTNGIITWTPSEAQGPGTNLITTVVTDSGSPPLSSTNSFVVVVNEINLPPVLPVLPNLTISGLAPLVVTNTATDPDIPVNTLTYVLTTAPANAQIDANGVITWTPIRAQVPSTNVFTTVVTDFNPDAVNSQHLSATNTFTVTVNPIHNGPSLPAQTNVTIDEMTLLTVTNTATDSDLPALALAYSLLNAPAGAQIDTNGIITWTPSEAQGPSTNVITTVVTDSGSPPLSSTNSFIVVVNEVNLPPVLPVLPDVTLTGYEPLVVTNTASDPDIPANTLTYSLEAAPANAQINSNGIITWTPGLVDVPSTNVFTTIVTDFNPQAVNEQHLHATNTFKVIVNAIHNGPGLGTLPNVTLDALSNLLVTNTATDTDVPLLPLTYILRDPPGGAQIDHNGIITWTPSATQAGTTNLFVTEVSDAGSPSLSTTNSFVVIVRAQANTNQPVIAAFTLTNNAAILTWSSIAGRNYRMQYNNDLNTTNWTDLAPDISATGTTASATNTVDGVLQRFYRVVLLP
jgi:hypothetical protein